MFSPPLLQTSQTLNEKEEKKAACLENLVNVELLNGWLILAKFTMCPCFSLKLQSYIPKAS